MSVLEIRDLHVTVETDAGTTPILNGVTLTIRKGETHAIMGPNGSGKSTLAYTIAGHPKYTVTGGTITLDGEDVLAMTVDERARAGLVPRDAVPGRDPRRDGHELPAHGQDRDRRRGAGDPHVDQGRQAVHEEPAHGPEVRAAQRQRGILGRREEAPRDPAARAAAPADRGPRRDRLRSRRRCAEDRLRGRQPRQGADRSRRAADHALHAHPALHPPRLRARHDRGPHRRGGRPRAGRAPRGRRLRPVHRASFSKPPPRAKRRIPL